jgi:hypothetical protein
MKQKKKDWSKYQTTFSFRWPYRPYEEFPKGILV